MELSSMDKPSSEMESVSFINDLSRLLLAKASKDGLADCQNIVKLQSLLDTGNYEGLCKFEVTYGEMTVYEAEIIRQVIGLYQKAKFVPVKADRKAAALRKWFEAEEACRQTNDLFSAYHSGACSFKAHVNAIYHRASRKIARVLGEVPPLSRFKFRFGAGANRSVIKTRASTSEKLGSRITCSEELFMHAETLLNEMPVYRDSHIDISNEMTQVNSELNKFVRRYYIGPRVPVFLDTGKVVFVPKDAFVDRPVDVPPSLNGLAQMGIGDYMVDRLALFGLQISDQAVNQSYAEIGSRTGEYATIDLTSASDMISRELVASLLPLDWWLLLSSTVVRETDVDGVIVKQHKFASMGNGFTFPLETLLFWALASSVKDDGWASVYGDDIVVKTEDYTAVIEILEHAGFVPNRKKSFGSGDFRESCGKDFYRGSQIRPVYQKELIDGFELFRLHNFFYRKGWLDVARWIKQHLPSFLIIYGPDGYGDGHLLGPWKGVRKDSHRACGYGGVLFDTYSRIGNRDVRRHRSGDRVLPQYSIYIRQDAGAIYETNLERLLETGFLRWFHHSFEGSGHYTSEPLGEVWGSGTKVLSFPGTCGYKRISIYTFAS